MPQLLLFNAADEVSCRAGAIKCSRCRASFARSAQLSPTEFGSPVGSATRRPIERNKELGKHLIELVHGQAALGPEKDLPVNERPMESDKQERWRNW
jgi:hypothetical protein